MHVFVIMESTCSASTWSLLNLSCNSKSSNKTVCTKIKIQNKITQWQKKHAKNVDLLHVCWLRNGGPGGFMLSRRRETYRLGVMQVQGAAWACGLVWARQHHFTKSSHTHTWVSPCFGCLYHPVCAPPPTWGWLTHSHCIAIYQQLKCFCTDWHIKSQKAKTMTVKKATPKHCSIKKITAFQTQSLLT